MSHKHLHAHFFCVFFWFSILVSSVIFPLHDSEARSVGFSLLISPISACQNRVDDDADGLTDYPDDPDCDNPEDTDETSVSPGTPGSGSGTGIPSLPDDETSEPPPVIPEESAPESMDIRLSEGDCSGKNGSPCIIQRPGADSPEAIPGETGKQEDGALPVPPVSLSPLPPKQIPPETDNEAEQAEDIDLTSAPDDRAQGTYSTITALLFSGLFVLEIFLTSFFNALWGVVQDILRLFLDFIQLFRS